jgi:hypothetical protein
MPSPANFLITRLLPKLWFLEYTDSKLTETSAKTSGFERDEKGDIQGMHLLL